LLKTADGWWAYYFPIGLTWQSDPPLLLPLGHLFTVNRWPSGFILVDTAVGVGQSRWRWARPLMLFATLSCWDDE
jgi:hypothetical protein